MEITDRNDLGTDLIAPTTDLNGKPYWGYELITHIQPGDIVFHWHKHLAGDPGIVGWSRATGAYEDDEIQWQAHSKAGIVKGNLKPRPAWRMPLLNYTALAEPVLIERIRRTEDSLRSIQTKLAQLHSGNTLYFPFSFSDKQSLRAQQTYLAKMPLEIVELFDLGTMKLAKPKTTRTQKLPGHNQKKYRTGYMADPAVRKAIERHSVELAIKHYEDRGYRVEDTGTYKPYDLTAEQGQDKRRVEVKGSSQTLEAVELTHGEVKNSRLMKHPTDLFVVERITWKRNPDGTITAEGGEIRHWRDWVAQDESLQAIRYRHTLPKT